MLRFFALVLSILLAILQLKLWVSGGMREVWRLEQQLVKEQERLGQAQERNELLAAEVVDLREGQEAIEERARAELGMVKTGEVYYQLIPKNAQGQTLDQVQAQTALLTFSD